VSGVRARRPSILADRRLEMMAMKISLPHRLRAFRMLRDTQLPREALLLGHHLD
jgi:hypothetical protein